MSKRIYQYLIHDTATGEMCLISDFGQGSAHKALCDKLLSIELQACEDGIYSIFKEMPQIRDDIYGMAIDEIEKNLWDIYLYDLSTEIEVPLGEQ